LKELSKPVYDSAQLVEDKEYVVKKLGLTMDEFQSYMAMPPASHLNYASYETGVYRTHEKVMRFLSPLSKLMRRKIK
jgi:hypothetical protein